MAHSPDSSRRFVLAADAALVKNLAVLWAVDPKLAAAIEGTDVGERHRVEISRSGAPTLVVASEDGRQVFLHSRHQPVDEARRLVEPLKTRNDAMFCVHGCGLGYHVEQLFDAASDEAILLVLEPDLCVLRAAFEQRDLSRLIESRRVQFITRTDKAELFARLTPHTALMSVGFSFVAHPPSMQTAGEFHAQMAEWISEFASYGRTSLNTLVVNGRRTCENIARNLAWYAAAPGINRLKDRYRGTPAIIVSAGPSLRKNKHLLKQADGKAIFIAVQTTLQPLLEMGVEPQFATSLDHNDISTRFFEKLPPTLRTELIAETKATSAIFSLNPGPLSILGNDLADSLLREMRLDKTRLRAGATVAHLAYYLAEHLGCDPIIFVGQDLGFGDGLCYMPGTSYEDVWRPELSRFCTVEMKQWEQIVRERPILRRISDYQGRPMYTEERLFAYLQQFERDFATATARVIDATEGGALKRGATPMPLAEVIEQYCARPVLRVEGDHPGYRWDLLGEVIASLQSRDREAAEIQEIARGTLPLLEEIRDNLGDQPRVNRTIARIDSLRARMNELGQSYDLITQMTQLTELQRFQRDRTIAAAKVEGEERQRRQVERDIENVRGVMEAAGEFRTLMADVIERVGASGSVGRQEAA